MTDLAFVKVETNRMTFFMCKLKGNVLAKVSYVARRRETEEEGAVQRILNRSRIAGIKDYLLNGGFFPNNLILNFVKPENLQFSDSTFSLTVEDRIAQIIDGQHRIEGLKDAIKEKPDIGEIEYPVIFTINLSTELCAELFISINTEQKTVPKSLIYDLYGLLSVGSRDFSIDRAADIADKLNTQENSPYFGYIKFPSSKKFKGGIQLSTFVNYLRPLVKEGGEFAKYSISTLELQTNILLNYFNALEKSYPKDWENLKNPFLYASGFGAAIDIFNEKILPVGFAKKKFSEEFFKTVLKFDQHKIFTQDDVKGLSGETARDKLKKLILENLALEETKEEEFEI